MCGIFGYIGKSKNPKVSYDLAQNLFLKTEIRGTDATGFYALQPGDGLVIFDKEPVKSSEYIKRDIWTRTFAENNDVDEFIGHCRQTSVGGGPEKVNRNNHPHWSDDRRVAMTHNGKIPEFSALKGRYDVESECDSEILLRMFESAQIIAKDREEELKKEFPTLTPFLAERLLGLKEIFSRVNYGAMAVAIAERGDDAQRYLWLFRDEERPLHVVDMRETLGQVFYVSTPEIWRNAVENTPSLKKEGNPEGVDYVSSDQVIIEFPAYQIWLLNLDPSKSVANENGLVEQGAACWNIRKFKITKTKYIDWKETEDEDDKASFKKPTDHKSKPPLTKIISRLGTNDTIVVPPKPEEPDIPLVIAVKDKDKKKTDTGSSRDTALRTGDSSVDPESLKQANLRQTSSISAKVNVGRDPGDETEYEAKHTDLILNKAEIVSAATEGVIDLDAFDSMIADIEQQLASLKADVHNKAKELSLPNKDFSQILDNLETMRQEATNANAVLSAK